MIRTFFLVAAFALSAGCGGGEAADRLPDVPARLILYSIDGPSYFKCEGELTLEQAKGEILHGYPVLGKVEITDLEQRRAVVAGVKEPMRDRSALEMQCLM